MSDKAFIGYGITFERGTGGPLVWTELARVLEITPPELARETADVTHLKSADRYREFIAAMRDGGEVSVVVIYNPENATHAALLTDFDSNEVVDYRITFPNDLAHQWTFRALVTGLSTPTPMEDKVTQSVTFKITGKPTLAASS